MNYTYIKDFYKSRENKIGASDIPWLVPHPENVIESLAAYTDNKNVRHACTANDLYYDKKNPPPREYNFAAEMGHYLEPKVLYEFIKDNISAEIAFEFFRSYMLHSLETELQSQKAGKRVCIDPVPYNTTPFRHNTEVSTECGVAHADCVYDPWKKLSHIEGYSLDNEEIRKKYNTQDGIIRKNNIDIDLFKPFLIEAKSANFFSVNARKKDKYKGYDLSLKEWQGIPLSHYMQIQYQLLLYNIEVCYLVLIYNTNEKHYWTIKANAEHQADLLQLATYMKQCLDTNTPPKHLAMNQKDIIKLYGNSIKEDFRELTQDELDAFLVIAKKHNYAKLQENIWKKKAECERQLSSIFLKDTKKIRAIIDGEMVDLACWKETGGGITTMGVKEIESREDAKQVLAYMKRKKLLKTQKEDLKATITIKDEYLKGE